MIESASTTIVFVNLMNYRILGVPWVLFLSLDTSITIDCISAVIPVSELIIRFLDLGNTLIL